MHPGFGHARRIVNSQPFRLQRMFLFSDHERSMANFTVAPV